MHRKISQTMRNFVWCAKFIFAASYGFVRCAKFRIVCKISHSVRNWPLLSPAAITPLDFTCYVKFLHSHAKLLHVGFLPLVFFLASLIGLATYCQAWKRAMKCSKTWILLIFELQLALPWIA